MWTGAGTGPEWRRVEFPPLLRQAQDMLAGGRVRGAAGNSGGMPPACAAVSACKRIRALQVGVVWSMNDAHCRSTILPPSQPSPCKHVLSLSKEGNGREALASNDLHAIALHQRAP